MVESFGDRIAVAHPRPTHTTRGCRRREIAGAPADGGDRWWWDPTSLLGALVGFDLLADGLALEAQRGDRARQQALEPDRLAALLALVDLSRLEPRHRLPDLAEQEGLPVMQPELGRVGLLLGGLVHRVPADPVPVAIHREVEGRVRVVGETAEVSLQARFELGGLLRRQHAFSLRAAAMPSIDLARSASRQIPVRAATPGERSRAIRGSADHPGGRLCTGAGSEIIPAFSPSRCAWVAAYDTTFFALVARNLSFRRRKIPVQDAVPRRNRRNGSIPDGVRLTHTLRASPRSPVTSPTRWKLACALFAAIAGYGMFS